MVEDQKDLMSLLKWTVEQNAAIRGDYCCSSCLNCSREFKDFDYENSADGRFKDLIKWLRDIGIDEHSIKIVSFYMLIFIGSKSDGICMTRSTI